MQIHPITSTGTPLDFEAALKRASAIAEEMLGESMLLSWYDRERDRNRRTMPVSATRVAPSIPSPQSLSRLRERDSQRWGTGCPIIAALLAKLYFRGGFSGA